VFHQGIPFVDPIQDDFVVARLVELLQGGIVHLIEIQESSAIATGTVHLSPLYLEPRAFVAP
jgi:hypothetical protein